jgi:hypothetical protein
MRLPVYPRGSDPRTSRPILRKSFPYAQEQVRNLLADWVDPLDPRKGIVAREFLPSGKVFTISPNELKTRFVANCRLLQPDCPTHYENDQIAALRIRSKATVLRSWDWTAEPATVPVSA